MVRYDDSRASSILRAGDPGFPECLRVIPDAPETIYYRGDISLLDGKAIAVVGSRKCTPYGARVAELLGERAAELGITVVNGMASGIDSVCQRAAENKGGKVIAVLAQGCDICYPRENRDLKRKIEESGLIISEHPDGTKPLKGYFPRRNRLISALASVVVIVEAAYKSGALRTAEYAVEQNKDLFAVPGNILGRMSMGTNKLIADGAEILTVIDEPFLRMGADPERRQARCEKLDGDEKKVYDIIAGSGEVSSADIGKLSGLSPQAVSGIVTVLEIKGLVTTCMGRVFVDKIAY